MTLKKENIGTSLLIGFGLISLITICIIPPINQDLSYHKFCDKITFFNISNFWNVLSNIPFAVVGVLGLLRVNFISNLKMQYLILFIGITLVSIGSGYYHLNPNNSTLIWDRLPMTIVFMSLFSIIISEFVNHRIGKFLLFPMLILGIVSVWYWNVFEDLKPYAFIQFYPILAIPVIMICYKSRYNKIYGYWLLLVFYVIAKGLEHFDCEVFSFFKILSGHSLKHIVTALGLFILYYTYIKREQLN